MKFNLLKHILLSYYEITHLVKVTQVLTMTEFPDRQTTFSDRQTHKQMDGRMDRQKLRPSCHTDRTSLKLRDKIFTMTDQRLVVLTQTD